MWRLLVVQRNVLSLFLMYVLTEQVQPLARVVFMMLHFFHSSSGAFFQLKINYCLSLFQLICQHCVKFPTLYIENLYPLPQSTFKHFCCSRRFLDLSARSFCRPLIAVSRWWLFILFYLFWKGFTSRITVSVAILKSILLFNQFLLLCNMWKMQDFCFWPHHDETSTVLHCRWNVDVRQAAIHDIKLVSYSSVFQKLITFTASNCNFPLGKFPFLSIT